jgi:protein phosphatase
VADTVVAAVAIEAAFKTHPGRDPDKQVNEDACAQASTPLGHLCVVCDGMGGHVGGKEASNLAVRTIVERLRDASPNEKPAQALREAILEANRKIRALPGDDPSGRPGSTVVAILVHPRGTEVAHVGDSRCYHLHSAQIRQVTKDHSMVQEMVDRGLLTPGEAKSHPEANKITRALGMDSSVDVEVRSEPIAHVSGDAFVLCTDGLCDLVDTSDILRIVGSAPPAQSAGQLVDLANARGGYDNITVLVARLKESANAGREPLAPTVAQTAAPAAAPGRGATAIGSAPGPSVPPDSAAAPRRSRLTLAIGIVLGVTALGIAIAMIVTSLEGRGGARRKTASTVDLGANPFVVPTTTMGAGADAAAILEPRPAPSDSIPPIPTGDLPPLAPTTPPLAPLGTSTRRPHRNH